VFINLNEGETLAKSSDYTGIIVVATSSKEVSTVESEVKSIFGSTVSVTKSSQLVSTLTSVSSSLGDILLAVGSVSLIVAFVGIMTTMFTTIYERRKEIGILKSLGYTSRNIYNIPRRSLDNGVHRGHIRGWSWHTDIFR
jgi:putative ABC transport system permease protein